MPAGVKTLHHFVPKLYLRAWAPDEHIYCLQNGEVTPRHLKNVAAEKYFYKLNEISPEDAQFIEGLLIKDSPEGMKESHRFLLHAFTVPHIAKRTLEERKRLIEESGETVDENAFRESMTFIDQQIVELNKNYHGSIENLFRPILESMRGGDLRFLEEEEKRFAFYFGLSVQYNRTNHIKGSRQEMIAEHYERYIRLANVITHIMAKNVGHSLIGTHNAQRIVLLGNASEIPFVTADQPIINLSANPKEFKPPAKFELFSPLSPTKAMMLLEPDSTHRPHSDSFSAAQAHHYNLLIAAHSFRQVYSNSEKELDAIRMNCLHFSVASESSGTSGHERW